MEHGIKGEKYKMEDITIHKMVEREIVIKKPQKPKPEDYYDILETEEERAERIYLYSEVVE